MMDLCHCTIKYYKVHWKWIKVTMIIESANFNTTRVCNFLVKKLFGWAVVLNEITLTIKSTWGWHHHAVWGAFLIRTGQNGASWEPGPECQDIRLGRRFAMGQRADAFGSLWRHVTVTAHQQSLTTLTEVERICREEWQKKPSSTLLYA